MVKYDRLRPELQALGVGLCMIGIGKPEVALRVCKEHLELDQPEDFIFVDPENALYDKLDLNVNLFTIATAFSFLDRFSSEGGMKDLNYVLSKWLPQPGKSEGAVIIPPKQRQAFNQGGTFIFKGKNTLLAHYDESTAAHADIERVKSIALDSL
uniref:Uncharacterized protein n=1 Tax=Corethron hystrix TaxID=216773 RepID=A0A7S1G041_9STRA|mmetsp:Transcript_6560/g.14165  ORF Transcript_6560/g.14165 Transcript_6560/m.14165 type:complete len:154 (+) Transcript_6560:514-975(+)